jgi:hypothetical protein
MGNVDGVRLVHSVGSARQLAALHKLATRQSLAGISIHKKLLDPDRVAALRRHADLLMTWPVLDSVEAGRLAGWGVDGLIAQQYETISLGLSDAAGEAA